jgi:hypothetical protein
MLRLRWRADLPAWNRRPFEANDFLKIDVVIFLPRFLDFKHDGC